MFVRFIESDETGHWYNIIGRDHGTEVELDAVYGVSHRGAILDPHGCPLTKGAPITIAIRNALRPSGKCA